jgi:hypothetical protein
MPTVIPASGAADGCWLVRGVALLAAGESRKAAGEAAASPAAPCPDPPCPDLPEPVAVLAQAVTRQADTSQARAASKPAWLARVRLVVPVVPVRVLARSLSR